MMRICVNPLKRETTVLMLALLAVVSNVWFFRDSLALASGIIMGLSACLWAMVICRTARMACSSLFWPTVVLVLCWILVCIVGALVNGSGHQIYKCAVTAACATIGRFSVAYIRH